MERWVGKVALVTGASAGIGVAVSESLARCGMKVVGMARRLDRMEALKSKLRNVRGEFLPVQGDLTKEEDIARVFDIIRERYGGIHVLINNAGMMKTGGLLTGDLQMFRQTYDVNVHGLISCTQKAVKMMRDVGVDDGHIVFVSSIVGHMVPYFPGNTLNVYPATKYSVTALAETFRQELMDAKTHIKVTCICPGLVGTEFSNIHAGTDFETKLARMPVLEASDVAESIVFALSTSPGSQICDIVIRPVNEPY